MHWAVRLSFERGFIDYIKHGNEQRLQGLSDALSEQYAQHGNWRFYVTMTVLSSRSCARWSTIAAMTAPAGMPPHGWRTQFWVIDQDMRTLVGPRAPIPGRHPAGNQSE